MTWLRTTATAAAIAASLALTACGGDSDADESYAVYRGHGVTFDYPDGPGWADPVPANVGEGMRADGPTPPEGGYRLQPSVRFDGLNPHDSNEEAWAATRDTISGFKVVDERPVTVEGALGARVFVTEYREPRRGGGRQTMHETTLFLILRDETGGRRGWELSVNDREGASYPDPDRVLDSLEVDNASG